jgi:hypothetical protein
LTCLVSDPDRSGIAGRTVIADDDIVNARGEIGTSRVAEGDIEIAGVEPERTDTLRRVPVARCVVQERAISKARVVVARRVALKCLVTKSRVVVAGCKVEESFVTPSRVFARVAAARLRAKFGLPCRPKRKAGKRDEEKEASAGREPYRNIPDDILCFHKGRLIGFPIY